MKQTTILKSGQVPRTKLFYRIQEVARMTGLKPYVLRYWESEFKELSPDKDRSDQRRYRPEDIEVVLAIRKLLYEDRFTIEGARKRLGVELRMRRENKKAAKAPAAPKIPERAPVMNDAAASQLAPTLRQLKSEVNALLELLGA